MIDIKILEEYVTSRTLELPPYVDAVNLGMDCISEGATLRLKLGVVLAELVTFASCLRKPIKLYDGTIVPVNSIVFALSGSGSSKDKSLNAVRKSLSKGYEKLQQKRLAAAEKDAKKKAKAFGDSVDDWRKHYKQPKPLQAGLGTVEGLMQHFSDISEGEYGAGAVLTSEIGSELQTNGQLSEIIKAVSVAYDLGNVPAKIIKSAEGQTEEIKGFPVNALFFGSQEGILFDNVIKSKFKMIFSTQLARRSTFVFTPETPPAPEAGSIDELYELREKERARVVVAQERLNNQTYEMIKEVTQKPLELTPEASKLFDVYLEYNLLRSNGMSNKLPISKLSQQHKQWLALKLSGAYAIFEKSDVITEEIYAIAINTVEMLAKDLTTFEQLLCREPYEQFVDMCKHNAEDEEFFGTLHELRKLGYISGTGASKGKLEDLACLASSCDRSGDYEATDHGIQYRAVVATDSVGLSFKIFEGNEVDEEFKEHAVANCEDSYEFYETTFDDLGSLLEENATYSPFRFKEGRRGKDNVVGSTKFVVLDIDNSFLTDKEIHNLLGSYNHYVVRTSDKANAYKFRILMEFDATLDVEDQVWKALITTIGEEFGFTVDPVPKSQIFLSFRGRDVLSQFEGKTLHTKDLLENAKERIKDKPLPPSQYSSKVKNQKLGDPRETFGFAFEAVKGGRSVKMYRALMYAIDLGGDAKYVENLANSINSYWATPMDEDRLERTLIQPALRKIGT